MAVAALGVGIGVLASFGPRYRVGRLLATTRQISVAEAVRAAESGSPRYVRVDGRLDSNQEFPDEDARPLVYRRRRLELRRNGRWERLEDQLEVVPFEVHEGLAAIGIDGAALDAGLVVLPRESRGTAGEVRERMPPATPAGTPVRYRIDQLSSVEHAVVLGVPGRTIDGRPTLGPGLGRPLIVTTLEIPEAMRILGGGRRRAALAASLLVAGLLLLGAGGAWALAAGSLVPAGPGSGPPVALAASPTAGAAAGAGDVRSAGEGPGLAGAPALAVLVVVMLAGVAVTGTLAWIRATGGPGRGAQ